MTKIVHVFADALPHVPDHRRLPILSQLVTTLGPAHFLWVLMLLLFKLHATQAASSASERVRTFLFCCFLWLLACFSFIYFDSLTLCVFFYAGCCFGKRCGLLGFSVLSVWCQRPAHYSNQHPKLPAAATRWQRGRWDNTDIENIWHKVIAANPLKFFFILIFAASVKRSVGRRGTKKKDEDEKVEELIFSVEDHSGKELRHFKFLSVSFMAQLLGSSSFISKVGSCF